MSYITKQAIKRSLENMLRVKPVNKITITDITNDCYISRMTFYYHFKDIYDLIIWAWMEEFVSALGDKKTYETWQQGFLEIFRVIAANKVYVENIYDSISKERIRTYLCSITYDLLINVVESQAVNLDVTEDDKKFIADFYKYAFVGIVLDWVQNKMAEDPQQIIAKINSLIEGTMFKHLNTCHCNKA
jgi:hypothetical protein